MRDADVVMIRAMADLNVLTNMAVYFVANVIFLCS